MRMRKKKHLDERLDAVSRYLFKYEGEDRNFKTSIEEKQYIDTEKYFGNNNPLYLEIGCGKGKFATEYAETHPDINLIAVEKIGNVIVSACEEAQKKDLKNIMFLKCGAEYLEKFIKENSVSGIFLNFSCPYPKKKYASHRLTHINFLEIYKRLMLDGAEIHQKTDNMHLFEFSIEQFSLAGFKLKNISLDLHNSNFEGNIMTEYEKRFTDLGQPIYRLEAIKKGCK